ncbi:inositol 2-dehydrogenase [Brevibacterium casei]|uniref:Myo-inositol 2-dehydrogenase / D-chiro-inositol 1-dehydrogenase n=2 Tax=Brevibacterium casei TaxID=33889 RepID=A0A2H1IRC9_9MICO|nr:inositol 2-dehydrogenase [Brevibacterium casei]QPR40946.1 inositol 2-dehydrogenase [Brevibacterium casei]QPR45475.1 inositol 2-dehydrogenase [Brevibacterium casei]SMX77745.1 myo-inositol 2-dehydrogenase / D-chiro-inositol 1-dehydrogenase [Brevibacterium casei CIP 102111]VEW15505.1 Inositol 2-dehydrogenase [Brevibacterium casei]
MSSEQLRFGLIGTGRIGKVHAANIAALPETTLSRVADPYLAGAQAMADEHGAIASADPLEAIGAGDLDAVIIASPTSTHADLIAAAIEARIPILCEKPIDLDIARVDELAPTVEESEVPFAVGFNRRFDRSFAAARERLLDGDIGELEQLSIISRDPAPPTIENLRTTGGIFRDQTIHDFDMARFFAPDIVEVFATGSQLFDEGAADLNDFDTAMVVMRTAGGAQISITNSRHSAIGYDQRIEVFGGRGMLEVGNAGTSLVRYSNSSSVQAGSPFQHFFLERYADAYIDELREFCKLVRGERSRCSTFEDGREALVLANAAELSAREGRAVKIDFGV